MSFPNGVTTCTSPGSGANQCGPGVKAGAKLQFTFNYATGVEALVRSVQVFKSDAAKAGIQYNLIGGSFATVSSMARCRASRVRAPANGSLVTRARGGSIPRTSTRPARLSSKPVAVATPAALFEQHQ